MARADDDLPEGHTLDDEDRALIAKLRELPYDGEEPDWRALEAQIRAQVAPLAMPSPWWRNWRWLVPIGALATTAAIVLVLATRPQATGNVATTEHGARQDAAVSAEPDPSLAATQHADDRAHAPTMWLDGEAVDIDEISDEKLEAALPLDGLLGEPDDVDAARALDDVDAAREPDDADLGEPGDAHQTIGGVLPDDSWIDALDDDAADRLEQFLARKRT